MMLNIDKICPFVRYVHYIEFKPQYTAHLQIAYDHRIFFCVKGNNSVTVDSVVYNLKENSLLFIPSGIPYHLHNTKQRDVIIGINFDFTYEQNQFENPIAPAFKQDVFDKNQIIESYAFTDIEQFNAPFMLSVQSDILVKIQKMLDEYTAKRLFYNQKNSAILKELLTFVARSLVTGVASSPQNTVDMIINYIQQNYMHRISNQDIGSALNFHPNYLNRLMLLNTGKTLHQYLLSYRLTKALDLLQTTSLTVTQISEQTGFSDVQQFCKFFLSQTGSTPSSFR